MLENFWDYYAPLLLVCLFYPCQSDFYENEIKCFCDKTSCPESLVCAGKWCLIGIRTDGEEPGRIDQKCGWDDDEKPPANCAEGWSKWAEVCACTETLCNTFAFLRSGIDQRQEQLLADKMESHNGRNDGSYGKHGSSKLWYQSNNQIILLLIIPLGVGGFLVCLIFLNFHCKMS